MKYDPTRTKLLREKFTRDLRKRYKELNKRIQDLVVERDVFGLKPRTLLTINTEWSGLSVGQQAEQYALWLEETIPNVQSSVEYWRQYALEAYEKGAGRAWDDINKGVLAEGTPKFAVLSGQRAEFMSILLRQPPIREKVLSLAARTFTHLKGVNQQMSVDMNRVLLDGLIQGQNPREVARTLKGISSKFGRRAETIARTETIRAHAEGQLDSMENLGLEKVSVMVEWSTAGDDRVCPQCSSLNGIVLKIKEARGLIPRHPNCRCSYIPANVGEDTRGQKRSATSIRSSLRKSVQAGQPKGRRRSRNLVADSTEQWKRPRISQKRPKPQ